MYEDDEPNEDGAVDILYLVDRLEELVGVGKRMPFSGRVMIEENQFLALLDQLRFAVPNEIKQAQRVIRERLTIVANAQEEAARILDAAKKRAEYVVSQEGLLNEAKQQSEAILQQSEENRKRAFGEIDVYAIDQFDRVENALREGLAIVDQAVRETVAALNAARDNVGR
jgi:endo-alpha-1,4-polygalactosaminidase (GH114 family)